MTGLSLNEAALIYCILGRPDPNYSGDDMFNPAHRIYPTIEESLVYMRGSGALNREFRDMDAAPLFGDDMQYEQIALFG